MSGIKLEIKSSWNNIKYVFRALGFYAGTRWSFIMYWVESGLNSICIIYNFYLIQHKWIKNEGIESIYKTNLDWIVQNRQFFINKQN